MIQRTIVNNWVSILSRNPNVSLVCLTGSLATGTETPASDIDICIYVYNHDNLKGLLDGLGEHEVSIWSTSGRFGEAVFARLLTHSGIVVDLGVFKDSGVVTGCEACQMGYADPEWTFEPTKFVATEAYPSKSLSSDELHKIEVDLLVVMAAVPSMFYKGEWESALFQLDLARKELIDLEYRLVNIQPYVLYKHFQEIFSRAALIHLRAPDGVSPKQIRLASECVYLGIGTCLGLIDNGGGGFDSKLYWGIYDMTISLLKELA